MKNRYEKQLLLEILTFNYRHNNIEKVKSLIRKSDINVLDYLTSLSGIDGFIYTILSDNKLNSILPESYMGNLCKRAGITGIKNSFIREHSLNIINLLNENNIDYIFFKGIPMSERLYEQDIMRAVSDIDILIKREQYKEVETLLENSGYRFPDEKMKALNVTFDKEDIENEFCEISFIKDLKPFPICIDLHFNMRLFKNNKELNELYPADTHDWFSNTSITKIDSHKVNCLNKEFELLNMIYHLSIHHSFMGIKWLLDICQHITIYQNDIDWERIHATAANNNLRRLISICLAMAEEIIGDDILSESTRVLFDIRKINKDVYRKMLSENMHSMRAKIFGRFLKILMPVSLSDRIKVFKYYFLERNSIMHRTTDKKNSGIDFSQPFKLLKVFIKDIRN